MSTFEKLGGTFDRRTLRLVEKTQEGQEKAAESLPPVFPILASPPSRARTTPAPQSFERYRRARPVQEPEGQATLPALPAPYRTKVPEQACLFCHGLGFLRKEVPYGHPEFGKLVACQCTVRKRVSRAGLAQIPEEFQERTFASYLEQSLEPEQELVAMQVLEWTMERLGGSYMGSKRGLYLFGELGIGKTGLAVAALQETMVTGKSGLYLSTSLLLDMLRESIAASQRLARGYGDEEDKQEESAGAKILRVAESVDWLVLDDLGVECGTEFVVNRLYRIIEGRRLQRSLYTIFTSNKDASGLEQRWRPARGGAFDDCFRVIDRLGEYCVMIAVEGRNLRQK